MMVLYLNVLEGCQEQDRFEKIINFVKKENPDVLGLSELNDWDKNDFSRLKEFQERTKLSNVSFCVSKSGYHLALFSKFKIQQPTTNNADFRNGEVTGNLEINGKNIFVILTHLNPGTEDERLDEIKIILQQIKDKENVILMGDMNSLSPHDDYEDFVLDEIKKRKITKFGENKLRRDVITKVESFGFVDLVKIFSSNFEFSVPSPITPEKDKLMHHFTKLRLDYIFVKRLSPNFAKIIRDKETDLLSDHYPVVAELDI